MPFIPHLDIPALVEAGGYAGLAAIVFAESGLFFGFFLPGDSLLFTAGILASQGVFSFPGLIALLWAAAVAGDSVGYWSGAKVGPALFTREDSFFFHKRHLERTRDFYAKYGPRAVVLARFVPIVRTFAPIFAGVGQMRYRDFFFFNVLGGLLWAVGIVSLGYFLGATVPDIERFIVPGIILIIVISFVPLLREWLRARAQKQRREQE